MQEYTVAWTKKISLNNSRDPLGLRPLKKLEDYYLPGITTQTHRLRYYSFLAWAYKKMRDNKIDPRRLLSMEKIVTLITQHNHQDNLSVPYGTRNTMSASDFLHRSANKRSIEIDRYTSFGYGGNNKIGYGTYYYRNSLAVLRIAWTDDQGRIVLSEVGEAIANLLENFQFKDRMLSDKILKKRLVDLHDFCLCTNAITKDEAEAWKRVFFGFTNVDRGQLSFHKEKLIEFQRGKLPFFQQPRDWYTVGKNTLDDIGSQAELQVKTVGRRGTLLMIMKVIENSEPVISELDQHIRDALYFRQFLDHNNKVNLIDFGKLESLRVLWEVYVHNLYFTSVLEATFSILLEILQKKPLGASLKDVLSALEMPLIHKEIAKAGYKASTIEELLKQINNKFPVKTTLNDEPNERACFVNSIQAETWEETLANLLILLCFLRHRCSVFSKAQLEILNYSEVELQSFAPTQFYESVLKGDIEKFVGKLLELLASRHRFIASMKYRAGTRFWLFTEEDGILFHYGKEYYFSSYPESKWRNVAELLLDMGLIERIGTILKVTRTGKTWLQRIK